MFIVQPKTSMIEDHCTVKSGTHVWEPIIVVYIEIDLLLRILSYPDSQHGNEGVRISEDPLHNVFFMKLFKTVLQNQHCVYYRI